MSARTSRPAANPKPALLRNAREVVPAPVSRVRNSVAHPTRGRFRLRGSHRLPIFDSRFGGGLGSEADAGCQVQLRIRNSRPESVGNVSRRGKWCIPDSECRKASPVCRITIPIPDKRGIKYEGASGDVYENIRTARSCTLMVSAFYREVYGFLRHLTGSGEALRRSDGHE